MMKQEYMKPSMEEITYEVDTVMMAESVYTEMDEMPGNPDANGRRGTWGNRWE